MSQDSRVEEVLRLFQEKLRRGESLMLQDLCGGSPELLSLVSRRLEDDLPNAPTAEDVSGGDPIDASKDQASSGTQERSPEELDRLAARVGATQPPRKMPDVQGYEVLSELGRGGMGIVYKARHKKLNRLVALKMVLAGAHARASQLARFHHEAEALASLQHPNIVQVYEVGEHDGCPYLALEYVEGGGLDDAINGKPLPPAQAARLVETLASAIHAAHLRGIIHRDLKPANVLLDCRLPIADRRSTPSVMSRSGDSTTSSGVTIVDHQSSIDNPKITDFGLAKRLEEEGGHTRENAVLGTPHYMAPEQARGRPREVGPHSDVYAGLAHAKGLFQQALAAGSRRSNRRHGASSRCCPCRDVAGAATA